MAKAKSRPKGSPLPPAVERIVAAVCAYYGISSPDLLGQSTRQTIVRARRVAMYLTQTRLQVNYSEIGRWLKRDHSTVIAGVAALEEVLKGPLAEVLQRDLAGVTSLLDHPTTTCRVFIASWPDGRYIVQGDSTQKPEQVRTLLVKDAASIGGRYLISERVVEVPNAG